MRGIQPSAGVPPTHRPSATAGWWPTSTVVAAPGRPGPACSSNRARRCATELRLQPLVSVLNHWHQQRGHGLQRLARGAVDGPLVHRDRAHRLVEVDRGLVPVEHPPLEPAVATLNAAAGQRDQQVAAQPRPAVGGVDVEVLEVDAVAAVPRGVVQEPDRHPDHASVDLGHVGEQRRVLPEEGAIEVGRRGGHGVRLSFVDGQVDDELVDGLDVAGLGGSDHPPQCAGIRRSRQRHRCRAGRSSSGARRGPPPRRPRHPRPSPARCPARGARGRRPRTAAAARRRC